MKRNLLSYSLKVKKISITTTSPGKMSKPRPQHSVPLSHGRRHNEMLDFTVKPAITGLVAGVGSTMTGLLPPKFNFGTRSVPTYLAAGTIVGLASLLAEFGHEKITPHISKDRKFQSVAGLLSPGIAGASTTLLFGTANSAAIEQQGVWELFLIGAVSEGLGDYLYRLSLPFLE